MKFVNNWKKLSEIDEFFIKFKILGLTVFSLELDWSRNHFSFTLLNFCVTNK